MYDEKYFKQNKILNRYQLAKLHTFEASARHQSFSLAARELCITPSAVSHQINQLETELGFKLFERFHRYIKLTNEGEKLFNTLQKLLYKLNQEVLDIKNQEISGQLNIYCRPSIAQCWLVPRLNKFTEKHPYITLNLLTGNENIDFNKHRIDIAIYYDEETHQDLFTYELMPEIIVPVCSPYYAQKYQLINNPSNLKNCRFIHDSQAWEYNSLFKEWQSWAEPNNIKINFNDVRTIFFDRSDLAIMSAVNNMGVAIGRKKLIKPFLDKKQLITPFPQLEIYCKQRYYAVTASINKPRINIFIEWLKDEINN